MNDREEHMGSTSGEMPAVKAARSILLAYGIDCATEAETRARVGVLDRMGAFAWSERSILKRAGLL
jgi:hypothetical protein